MSAERTRPTPPEDVEAAGDRRVEAERVRLRERLRGMFNPAYAEALAVQLGISEP